jgi:hypothetical protein
MFGNVKRTKLQANIRQVHIRPSQRAVDFPELGPAILHLAEIAACDLQLVHVRCIGILDGLWTLHFHLFSERQGAGSERPVERLHMYGQLAVLKLGSVVVMVYLRSLTCATNGE